jgi:hypothetical protein
VDNLSAPAKALRLAGSGGSTDSSGATAASGTSMGVGVTDAEVVGADATLVSGCEWRESASTTAMVFAKASVLFSESDRAAGARRGEDIAPGKRGMAEGKPRDVLAPIAAGVGNVFLEAAAICCGGLAYSGVGGEGAPRLDGCGRVGSVATGATSWSRGASSCSGTGASPTSVRWSCDVALLDATAAFGGVLLDTDMSPSFVAEIRTRR